MLNYMLRNFQGIPCAYEGNLNPAQGWWTPPLTKKSTIQRGVYAI